MFPFRGVAAHVSIPSLPPSLKRGAALGSGGASWCSDDPSSNFGLVATDTMK